MIEVAVTLVVLSVCIVAVGPSAVDWIHTSRVRAAAEALQTGLQTARIEALKRNQPVGLWIVSSTGAVPDSSCRLSSASASWVVSLKDPTGKCDVAPGAQDPYAVEVHADLSPGLVIAARAVDGTTNASSVTFDAYGRPTYGTAHPVASIDVNHVQPGARALRVEVSLGGSIRVCDPAVASTDPRACCTDLRTC